MQRYEELLTTPTCTLINYLSMAEEKGNQTLVNICAYELACRLYVPNKGVDFDKLVAGFGYKEQEEEVVKEEKGKTLTKRKR